MNIEQIKYIVEVAKTNSISTAAQNLYVTPSAISQSIILLEKELGIKLFWRSRKGVTITPEGESIVSKAIEISELLNQIHEESIAYRKKVEGHLKLAVIAGVMPLLIETIAEFRRDYPDLEIDITESSSHQIKEALKNNEYDLGVISMRSSDPDKQEFLNELKYHVITEAKINILLPKSSSLASNKSISAEELRQQTIVLYKDDYLDWFVDDFSSTFGSLNIMLTTHNIEAIRSVVQKELGVTIGFNFLLYDTLQRNGLISHIPLEEYQDERIEIGWTYLEKKALTPIAKKFIQRCEDILKSK